MSNLQFYSFNASQIRVIDVDGNPWFVASDICQILGINNVSQAVIRLKPCDKEILNTEYMGLSQNVLCVSVSGTHQLILFSRSLVASSFQDWIVQLVTMYKSMSPVIKADPTNLKWHSFNGSNIRFELRDGRVWVSLTDMAQASGKRMDNWTRLDGTKEFLSAMEQFTQKSVIEYKVGNIDESIRGTWAIEEVALEFAGWCSVPFKIWMLSQIKTLMSEGTVSLAKEKEDLEMKKMMLTLATAVDAQNEKIKLLEGGQSLAHTIKTELSNLADVERYVKSEPNKNTSLNR